MCRCQSLAEEQIAAPKICLTCGKQITDTRPGSFTQWIFSPIRCSCAEPKICQESEALLKSLFENQQSIDSQMAPNPDSAECDAADMEVTEQELALVPSDFPVKRYSPQSQLGRGACGTVYLCRDRLIGTSVAVKFLHVLNEEQLLSFQQEARISSKLDHPNIVKILDFGPTESGAPYMVLQYAPGMTLQEYLAANGPMKEADASRLFSQVCQALDHAHARGVFHRDLKPSNVILVNQRGEGLQDCTVKLIDFGVAKIKQQTQEPTIVQGRTIVGTPSYMPPEVINGKEFDARSEIYSLGCLIFEAIAGRPPFRAESTLALLGKHVSETPPKPSVVSGMPSPLLDRIVMKCLKKDPDKRFQSVASILQAMHSSDYLQGATYTIAQRTPRPRDKRMLVAGAVVLVLSGMALLKVIQSSQLPFLSAQKSVAKLKPAKKTVRASDLPSFQYNALPGDRALTPGEHPEHPGAVDGSKYATMGFKEMELAALQGDFDAQTRLAEMYRKGQGTPRDLQSAIYWFKQAAKQGDARADNQLGVIYGTGEGVAKDYKESARWYREGADRGQPTAQYNLGIYYRDGKGVPQDYNEALKLYLLAADKGWVNAINEVGVCYFAGRGVRQDYSEAARWFRKAAERGHTGAQHNLGVLYLRGQGLPRSTSEALKWFKKTAENGDSSGECSIGFMYCDGEGVAKNASEAYRWFSIAAKKGNAQAINALGVFYRDGKVVKQNYGEALRCFFAAAEKGEPLGFYNLGCMYKSGRGVQEDNARAAIYFTKSAELGYANAQFNTAVMYEKGWGVKQNMAEAIKWYRLAAKQGFKQAQARLATIDGDKRKDAN